MSSCRLVDYSCHTKLVTDEMEISAKSVSGSLSEQTTPAHHNTDMHAFKHQVTTASGSSHDGPDTAESSEHHCPGGLKQPLGGLVHRGSPDVEARRFRDGSAGVVALGYVDDDRQGGPGGELLWGGAPADIELCAF